MGKRSKVVELASDPALPTQIVEVAGQPYRLCMDIGTLVDTDAALKQAGHKDVDLLYCLPGFSAEQIQMFFGIAVQRFHPDLDVVEAGKLLHSDISAFYRVKAVIRELWNKSTPQAKEGEDNTADPTKSTQQ